MDSRYEICESIDIPGSLYEWGCHLYYDSSYGQMQRLDFIIREGGDIGL